MKIQHTGFQSLLYEKFVIDKVHDGKKVAPAMGIAPSTLYGYIEGKQYMPPDLIARLYKATGDVDFLNFIIDKTDQSLRPRETHAGKEDLKDDTLDVASAAGAAVAEIQKALADDNVSEVEKQRITKRLNVLMKEIEDVRAHVKEK